MAFDCREVTLSDLYDALADYIETLSKSADDTRRSEDRPKYAAHLASAARMFLAIHRDRSRVELDGLVASERRAYGWSYLSDEEGDRAEAAFTSFASRVDDMRGEKR
jgi:hypothetical protein